MEPWRQINFPEETKLWEYWRGSKKWCHKEIISKANRELLLAKETHQLLKFPGFMTVATQAIASYDGDEGWDLPELILDEYLSYDALE